MKIRERMDSLGEDVRGEYYAKLREYGTAIDSGDTKLSAVLREEILELDVMLKLRSGME